jgi:phage tail sheath gpL-like
VQYVDSLGRFCSKFDAYKNGILKDGYSVRVPMMLSDSGGALNFADAERAFADSAEGQRTVAYARHLHDIRERSHGALARPFTDADALAAIRCAMAGRASATEQRTNDAAASRAADYREGARAAWVDNYYNKGN